MEKNNDTQMFDKDKQKVKKSNEGIKVVGAALVGSIVGSSTTTLASELVNPDEPVVVPEPVPDPAPVDPAPVDPEPVDPEPIDPVPVDPEPVDPGPQVVVSEPKSDPEPVPEHKPDSDPEPDDTLIDPVVPVEEIDPNDIDMADVIEDVTNVEVVYDVNGNEMIVATAHNSTVGEFYLIDVDVDGDIDVMLDAMGNMIPIEDQLITLTDIDAKINEGYIPPTEADDIIAQNNMIGEDIQQDIIYTDDNNA